MNKDTIFLLLSMLSQ